MSDWLSLVGKLIEPGEGFRSHPYQDFARAIWTIGFGATETMNGEKVSPNTPPISESTARLWYQAFCKKIYEEIVEEDEYFDLLEDYQIAAVVDFAYRFGVRELFGSSLWRYIVADNEDAAANEFLKWDHAKVSGHEVVVEGLDKRCKAEKDMFEGNY